MTSKITCFHGEVVLGFSFWMQSYKQHIVHWRKPSLSIYEDKLRWAWLRGRWSGFLARLVYDPTTTPFTPANSIGLQTRTSFICSWQNILLPLATNRTRGTLLCASNYSSSPPGVKWQDCPVNIINCPQCHVEIRQRHKETKRDPSGAVSVKYRAGHFPSSLQKVSSLLLSSAIDGKFMPEFCRIRNDPEMYSV